MWSFAVQRQSSRPAEPAGSALPVIELEGCICSRAASVASIVANIAHQAAPSRVQIEWCARKHDFGGPHAMPRRSSRVASASPWETLTSCLPCSQGPAIKM